jgi:hypothetical protein
MVESYDPGSLSSVHQNDGSSKNCFASQLSRVKVPFSNLFSQLVGRQGADQLAAVGIDNADKDLASFLVDFKLGISLAEWEVLRLRVRLALIRTGV